MIGNTILKKILLRLGQIIVWILLFYEKRLPFWLQTIFRTFLEFFSIWMVLEVIVSGKVENILLARMMVAGVATGIIEIVHLLHPVAGKYKTLLFPPYNCSLTEAYQKLKQFPVSDLLKPSAEEKVQARITDKSIG